MLIYMKIHKCLLRSGKLGGSVTAIRLLKEITKHLQPVGLGADYDVVMDFYTAFSTLMDDSNNGEAAVSDECLREFVQGFNSSQPLFNMVDVGYDEELRCNKTEGSQSFRRSAFEMPANLNLKVQSSSS